MILAEGGVNPKTVMKRLGHKDIKTTLQTYTFNTETRKYKSPEEVQVLKILISTGDSYFKI